MFGFAPASRSISMSLVWPHVTAQCRAVLPNSASGASITRAHVVRSSRTASTSARRTADRSASAASAGVSAAKTLFGPRLMLAQAAVQGGEADPQPGRRRRAVALRLAQGEGDRLLLRPRRRAAGDLGEGAREVDHVPEDGPGPRFLGEAQVGGLDRGAVAEDGRPLQRVLQLADVAGPGVVEERALRSVGQAEALAAHLARVALEEGLGEGEDVPAAPAEGRDLHGEDGE